MDIIKLVQENLDKIAVGAGGLVVGGVIGYILAKQLDPDNELSPGLRRAMEEFARDWSTGVCSLLYTYDTPEFRRCVERLMPKARRIARRWAERMREFVMGD